MKYKKCPFCGEKIVTEHNKLALNIHVEKVHPGMIPSDSCAGEVIYLQANNGRKRVCMMCRKHDTVWDVNTNRYKAFCCSKCKDDYVAMARSRLKKVYGKENLLGDPNQQKKMLAHRRISGIYKHSDGGEWQYTGSYEEDFCKVNDSMLNIPSGDILMPSPNVYKYTYEGEEKFYFPDAFIPSLGLEIEIKDGGDNPNKHHKIQEVDKVKEHLKDDVLKKQHAYHYIKIVNKDYKDYFKLIERLKSGDITDYEEKKKIKVGV